MRKIEEDILVKMLEHVHILHYTYICMLTSKVNKRRWTHNVAIIFGFELRPRRDRLKDRQT